MKRGVVKLCVICCSCLVLGSELSPLLITRHGTSPGAEPKQAWAVAQRPLILRKPTTSPNKLPRKRHQRTWHPTPLRPDLRHAIDEPQELRYPSSLHAAGESNKDVAVTYGQVQVREWNMGDFDEIYALLTTEDFDPEGPLSSDCGSASAMRDAYNSEDGGCFLVATASGLIVGTGALTAGTQVTTLSSGASVSKEGNVGAMRRAAVSADMSDEAQRVVWDALVLAIQRRAVQIDCVQLIALAFLAPPAAPAVKSTRPTASILSSYGFSQGNDLPGTHATQYTKDLQPGTGQTVSALTGRGTEEEAVRVRVARDGDLQRGIRLLVGRGSGVIIAASLVLTALGAVGIASLLGLDLSLDNSTNNRGLGTPLSSAQVRQLMKDETLKRSSLDSDYEQLSPEQLFEEEALRRVISGGQVRVK